MSDDSADLPIPVASRLWWAVPAVGLILLSLFAMVFGGGPEKVDWGTSYDASPAGFRAAYLLLEELKYPVERSRRPASGGDVLWVLFPNKAGEKEARAADDWVRRGGVMLLAAGDGGFGERMDFPLTVTGAAPAPPTLPAWPGGPVVPRTATRGEPGAADTPAPDLSRLYAGATETTGPAGGRVWAELDGRPLVTVHPRGAGEVWLVNRPDVLANVNLREGDNAVFAARLADATLAARPGARLAFDEYLHGLRDRPGVADLLFRPPALGVTLQALAVAALVVWHFGVRFGPARPAPPPARRSKEEFLDAMAELLARKGDRAEAFRTVRDDFRRRLETELGLPAGAAPDVVAREAARRRGVEAAAVEALLAADAPPGGAGSAAFLASLHQLETLAHECSHSGRRAR